MLKKHKPEPSYTKQLSKFANNLIDKLWCNNYQDQQKSPIFPISDIVLGGSVAKGTWLKDTADIFLSNLTQVQIGLIWNIHLK